MDPEVVTAGTLVASVLEHMGYMTQASFLEAFKGFFRDAGALIYLISAVGGVVSVMMYGSFRAARYLLIGPAFFWFLVGPTTETQGVLWRVGDGEFRGKNAETGQAAATEYRDDILKKLGYEQQGTGVSGTVKTATGFWLFAYPINEFVREFVGVLLKDETGLDKLVVSKTRSLEIMFHAIPREPGFINRIEEGLMRGCSEMFTAAIGGAHAYVRNQGAAAAGAEPNSLENLKEYYRKRVEAAAVNGSMSLDTTESGFREYIEMNAGLKSKKGEGTPNEFSIVQQQRARFVSNDSAVSSIKCEDAFVLVAEEAWFLAMKEVVRLIDIGSNNDPSLRGATCKALELKLFGGDQPGECEQSLTAGVALVTLANHMKRADTFSRVMKRHWNNRDLINPKRNSINTGTFAPHGYELVRDPNNNSPSTRMGMSRAGVPEMQFEFKKTDMSDTQKPNQLWAPNARIDSVDGVDHAQWVSMARYQTANMRQQIFTWAMQLPYYQGVLLYIIAVAYPFIALIVLVPGRAQNVINIPLAWFWVKSWDIGFAAVIILDKVLYNMIPTVDLDPVIRNGPWRDVKDFPLIMSEALKMDPTMSPHLYYVVLSMILFMIPPIFGAITLKGKAGILSAWTDAVGAQARDAGSRAGSAYGIVAANDRQRMGKQIRGYAQRSALGGGGGLSGPGSMRGGTAAFWAGVATTKTVLSKEGVITKIPGTLAQFQQKKFEFAKAELGYDQSMREVYDPMVGRWGSLSMIKDAYAAAMDPGGFEMEARTANASGPMVGVFLKKMETAFDASGAVIQSATNKAGDVKGWGAMDVMFYSSLAANAPEFLEAGTGKNRFKALKDLIGVSNYSDAEVMSRLWHVDAEDANGEANANGVAGDLFNVFGGFVNSAQESVVPGGPNSVIERHLATSGGMRGAVPGQSGLLGAGKNGVAQVQGALETLGSAVTGEKTGADSPLNPANRFGSPGAPTFADGLAYDTLKQKDPKLYNQMLAREVYDLSVGYGYYDSASMTDIANRLREEKQRVQNNPKYGGFYSDVQHGEIPMEILDLADTQPLHFAHRLKDWNESRTRSALKAFGMDSSGDDAVTRPWQLFEAD